MEVSLLMLLSLLYGYQYTQDGKNGATHEWSYAGLLGVSVWHKWYPACGGIRQSPINIETSIVKEDNSLNDFKFFGCRDPLRIGNFTLTNNGHTAQIAVDGNCYVEGANLPGRYLTTEFHFHWGSTDDKGSEHTIDGRRYPMELHLIHKADRYGNLSYSMQQPDGLAVSAVFFELSAQDNPDLLHITDALPAVINYKDQTPVSPLSIEKFIPRDSSSYYRYLGSLTTPPCSESVIWTVFTKPLKISRRQLARFRNLIEKDHTKVSGSAKILASKILKKPRSFIQDNFRNTQPLNGRSVFMSKGAAVRMNVKNTKTNPMGKGTAQVKPDSNLLQSSQVKNMKTNPMGKGTSQIKLDSNLLQSSQIKKNFAKPNINSQKDIANHLSPLDIPIAPDVKGVPIVPDVKGVPIVPDVKGVIHTLQQASKIVLKKPARSSTQTVSDTRKKLVETAFKMIVKNMTTNPIGKGTAQIKPDSNLLQSSQVKNMKTNPMGKGTAQIKPDSNLLQSSQVKNMKTNPMGKGTAQIKPDSNLLQSSQIKMNFNKPNINLQQNIASHFSPSDIPIVPDVKGVIDTVQQASKIELKKPVRSSTQTVSDTRKNLVETAVKVDVKNMKTNPMGKGTAQIKPDSNLLQSSQIKMNFNKPNINSQKNIANHFSPSHISISPEVKGVIHTVQHRIQASKIDLKKPAKSSTQTVTDTRKNPIDTNESFSNGGTSQRTNQPLNIEIKLNKGQNGKGENSPIQVSSIIHNQNQQNEQNERVRTVAMSKGAAVKVDVKNTKTNPTGKGTAQIKPDSNLLQSSQIKMNFIKANINSQQNVANQVSPSHISISPEVKGVIHTVQHRIQASKIDLKKPARSSTQTVSDTRKNSIETNESFSKGGTSQRTNQPLNIENKLNKGQNGKGENSPIQVSSIIHNQNQQNEQNGLVSSSQTPPDDLGLTRSTSSQNDLKVSPNDITLIINANGSMPFQSQQGNAQNGDMTNAGNGLSSQVRTNSTKTSSGITHLSTQTEADKTLGQHLYQHAAISTNTNATGNSNGLKNIMSQALKPSSTIEKSMISQGKEALSILDKGGCMQHATAKGSPSNSNQRQLISIDSRSHRITQKNSKYLTTSETTPRTSNQGLYTGNSNIRERNMGFQPTLPRFERSALPPRSSSGHVTSSRILDSMKATPRWNILNSHNQNSPLINQRINQDIRNDQSSVFGVFSAPAQINSHANYRHSYPIDHSQRGSQSGKNSGRTMVYQGEYDWSAILNHMDDENVVMLLQSMAQNDRHIADRIQFSNSRKELPSFRKHFSKISGNKTGRQITGNKTNAGLVSRRRPLPARESLPVWYEPYRESAVDMMDRLQRTQRLVSSK